jgi:acetyl-CoA acetyltransferase
MGIGPVPATNKLLQRLNLTLDDFDVLELNEAFSAQALACTRQLGLADDDPRINTRGGAIALGHPLGMSGALCTMCIGVGQGIAVVLESIR